MPGATSALYEPLIARDLSAIPAAARAFAASKGVDELYLAVARFSVLAYAPSQHAKRAVMACRAALDVRDEMGERWIELMIECASYAAESRQPWSEPPILDPPPVDADQRRDLDELREAASAHDRLRAERWLSARLDDESLIGELLSVAKGDALLMTSTAAALISVLGEKGRFALLRMPISELCAQPVDAPDAPSDVLPVIDAAIHARGTIDTGYAIMLYEARRNTALAAPLRGAPTLGAYRLARDYAQTLILHAVARRLHGVVPDERLVSLLEAVHDNLQNGDSFAEWSFA